MQGEKYDTIIVGAGPAGSFSAYQLAKKGRHVLVLEKKAFPRYKACGGALSSRAVDLLPFAISPVVQARVHEIIFTLNGEKPISGEVDKPFAFMVMRSMLDSFLLEKAQEEGAIFYPNCQVVHLEQQNDRVLVFTAVGETFQGDYLIGADGVMSTVARSCGLNQNQKKGFTIEGELMVSSSFLEEMRYSVHIDPGIIPRGYGWIFPKGDHLSIGVGQFRGRPKNIKERFQAFLTRWDLLEEGTLERLKGSFIPVGGRIGDLTSHRVLLVGDAAGLVDPLSGEGIYYALKSGLLAAQVLLSQERDKPQLQQYQRLIKGEFGTEFLCSLRLSDLFYHFTPFAYQVLERNPEILIHLLEMVGGGISHHTFYDRMKGYIPIIKKLVMT